MYLYGQYCPVARASEILAGGRGGGPTGSAFPRAAPSSSSTSAESEAAATGSSWSGPTCRCASSTRSSTSTFHVSADIAAFYRVWLGRTTLAAAMRAGLVRIDGMPAAARAFPRWFAWSPMADAVRAAFPGRATVTASG